MNASHCIAALIFLPLALGCQEDSPAADSVESAITWHQDVAPIVHEKCVGCHTSDNGIAPFALETFEQASPIAGFMLSMVEAGEMPPWSARSAEDCTPEHDWERDARLSAEQLATLQAWVAQDAPEGDPATAVLLPERAIPGLQGVTKDMAITPYTASGTEDQLVCFVLDPEAAQTEYITGIEIQPTNLQVAHHATLSVVRAENAQEVRDLVGADGSFPCTGVASLPGSQSLGGWVPGTAPFEMPDSSGTQVSAGSILVLQMHYHPTGLEHAADETRVKLRTTSVEPEKKFVFALLGNAGNAPVLQPGEHDDGETRFFIPANVTNHSESMVFTIDVPQLEGKQAPLVAVTPHMHYVGQSMQVTLQRGAPRAEQSDNECLVNVEGWNFDWQRNYRYASPLEELSTVTQGDTVTLECNYNNSLSNRFVQRMLSEEGLENPVDVLLGDETTDEMCVVVLGLVL